MKNYKMVLQYDGTRYRGWQKQKNTEETIQGKLEAVLQRVFGAEVLVHGAGRTDAGVHAWGQVANFWLEKEVSPLELQRQLNELLPQDIWVRYLEEAPERFHSRLWASRKHYRYQICLGQRADVFQRKYLWLLEQSLDIERMRQAAKLLLGTKDFRALCDEKKKEKSTVRTLEEITITTSYEDGNTDITLDFYGDGFLYHEVRHITALLVNVASGKEPMEQILKLLETPGAHYAALAPAHGLCLVSVEYLENK